MALQIIQSLAYASIDQIISYYPFPSGSIEAQVTQWQEIPMYPTSGELATVSRTTESGTTYGSNISARIKSEFQLPDAAILKITLCSGEEYIIGSPDIPVRINQSLDITKAPQITINHTSHIPPLKPLN